MRITIKTVGPNDRLIIQPDKPISEVRYMALSKQLSEFMENGKGFAIFGPGINILILRDKRGKKRRRGFFGWLESLSPVVNSPPQKRPDESVKAPEFHLNTEGYTPSKEARRQR